MCRSHTYLASDTGAALPAAPVDIAGLPAAERKVRGRIDAILGQACKKSENTRNRIAGWLEEVAKRLRSGK